MKTIYLIRHAKSSWKEPVSDFDRGLNKRGKRDLPFMANLIKSKQIVPDLILSSPAKRTKLTAEVFARELKVENLHFEHSMYESSYNTLLNLIRKLPNDMSTVFLVGHNPGLNMLAGYLSGKYIENIPTCAVYGLEFECNEWMQVEKAQGENTLFEYPKKYLKEKP